MAERTNGGMKQSLRWSPAAILAVAALFTVGIRTQRTLELREPLATAVPTVVAAQTARDAQLSEGERRAVGVTDYLLRDYSAPADSAGFSLYVGYYDRQTQGKTIHSPKNCLPGAGWEALASTSQVIRTNDHRYTVNRYLIQNGKVQALVLYWYQGRGRVAYNEYRVKWNLLRDAALRQRSDEALVRIVVPITAGEDSAASLATAAAETVIPALWKALPG